MPLMNNRSLNTKSLKTKSLINRVFRVADHRRSRQLLAVDDGVWIIGASSGIGAALATALSAEGITVVISARSRDELTELAKNAPGAAMKVVPLDATDPEAVRDAAEEVQAILGRLHTVVWMAGFWKQMKARAWDSELFARHVEVNLLGLNNVLGAVIPPLVDEGCGRIVITASVAGFRGIPGSEAYGATKAAQINLAEALRGSLAHTGVEVSVICPGFVRTPMTDQNEFPMPFIIEAEEAASAIIDGLKNGDFEITFPLPMSVAMHTARLLPNRIWFEITKRARG